MKLTKLINGLLLLTSLCISGTASTAVGAENEFIDLLAGGDLKEYFETSGNWTVLPKYSAQIDKCLVLGSFPKVVM
jgi:hypothetical protein